MVLSVSGWAVFPTPVGMVPMSEQESASGASFPHARGDGPSRCASARSPYRFSPRPWGWSDCSILDVHKAGVFPTPVGMVRLYRTFCRTLYCFPHARGDGPTLAAALQRPDLFSPRPWGWSVTSQTCAKSSDVFPTPVGMVPQTPRGDTPRMCFPHARGDGPLVARVCGVLRPFSPRPWGWSQF